MKSTLILRSAFCEKERVFFLIIIKSDKFEGTDNWCGILRVSVKKHPYFYGGVKQTSLSPN